MGFPHLIFCPQFYRRKVLWRRTSHQRFSPCTSFELSCSLGIGKKMAVEIVESCMVTPCEATPQQGLWLSNLDLLVARSHTPTVYLYRRHNSRHGPDFFSPGVLKAALSKAMVTFYPLAGRLDAQGGSAGRPEIRCTGEGALFVTARSDATLDDLLGDLVLTDEMRRMLVPSANGAGEIHAGILAMFQVKQPLLISPHFSIYWL